MVYVIIIISLLGVVGLMYLGGKWGVYEKVNSAFAFIKNMFKSKGSL